MKIAMVGAGGIGAYFGGCLLRAGYDVSFVVTDRHVQPIRDSGLRVTTDHEDFVVKPTVVTTSPRDIGLVDVVIVAVKTYQLAATTADISCLVGPNTVVLTLQNGVSAAPLIHHTLGDGHVVPGLAVIVAFLEEPGHVRQTGGRPGITLGPGTLGAGSHGAGADIEGGGTSSSPNPIPLIDPRIEALAQALTESGVTSRVSQDIDRDLWRKFALITSFGGVGTLTHSTIGEFREWAPTRTLLSQALDEVKSLANARGIAVSDDDLAQVLAQLDSLAPESTSSMQRDLMSGHISELADQNGTVVQLAAESGVSVPLHSVIYRVLSLYEHRGRV